jgi:Protein of unknown function (DUF1214)
MNENGTGIQSSQRLSGTFGSAVKMAREIDLAPIPSHQPVLIDATHRLTKSVHRLQSASTSINHLYALAFPATAFTDTASADPGHAQSSLWSGGPDAPHTISVPEWGARYHLLEVIWSAWVDDDGRPFNSAGNYMLHFCKEKIPPVRGFWSLTMHDEKQLFAGNSINRHAVSNRDPLKFHEDGSLDLFIQRDCPGIEKRSNWLPAPQSGPFTMNLRLHWPDPEALHGAWLPPTITRVGSSAGLRA